MRFAQLRNKLPGISEKVLTQTLRNLQRDGIVDRHVLGGIPPALEYSLTEFGQQCARRVDSLIDWIETRAGRFIEAHETYDSR